MFDYNNSRITAQKLVKKYGTPIVLKTYGTVLTDSTRPFAGTTRGNVVSMNSFGIKIPSSSVKQFGLDAMGEGTSYTEFHKLSENFLIFSITEEVDFQQFREIETNSLTWGIIALQVLRPSSVTILGVAALKR